MPNRPKSHRPPIVTRRPPVVRLSAHKRGYNAAWQRASKGFLEEHPLCVECEREGRVEPATQVDHIIPHRGDSELFWRESNWQGLCDHHHAKKTARGE